MPVPASATQRKNRRIVQKATPLRWCTLRRAATFREANDFFYAENSSSNGEREALPVHWFAVTLLVAYPSTNLLVAR